MSKKERDQRASKGKKGFGGPVYKVGQIEVVDVVAGDDVRVGLADELRPALEQRRLVVVGNDVGADDRRARVEREHVTDERLRFALVDK